MTRYVLVIPAAGIGQRMGSAIPKQYLKIRDKTVLEHTLSGLLAYPCFSQVIVVLHPQDVYWPSLKLTHPKLRVTYTGGEKRVHSVLSGLLALQPALEAQDWVLVHDAVRPCLSCRDLDHLIKTLLDHPVGGLLGVPIHNALKKVNAQRAITATPSDSSDLWQALTPQMFRYGLLRQALQAVINDHIEVRDEASALEYLGAFLPAFPQMVVGSADNIKVTMPEDLVRVETYLSRLAE